MNMNSDNIINKLKCVLQDEFLCVEYVPPPPYLLPFMRHENNVIYCYKKKESINDTSIIRNSFCSNSSEELDITGQPLECPFSINDETDISINISVKREEKDTHYPLTIADAIKIGSVYNMNLDTTIPCFVLTDGSNLSHAIIFGFIKNNGWRKRCWITSEDAFSNSKMNVDKMMQHHYQLSMINPIHTVSEVFCRYNIEYVDDKNRTFVKESPGSIELNLNWKTPSFDIPLHEASVKITINTCIGFETSDITIMWDQLTLLYEYLEVIKKWKEEKIGQSLYSRHGVNFPNIKQIDEPSDQKTTDQLIQLLEEPNKYNVFFVNKIIENDVQNIGNIVKKVLKEKEKNFTDKLWSLLIKCSSYAEMCSCLDKVFQYVKNGLCKPYMKSTNISRLSDIFRCCLNSNSNIEMILEPLELLIEIGIEKLKEEYLNIFLLAKIATIKNLNIPKLPKFAEVNASEWVDTCSKWIKWLMRIHISLQLLLTTESIMKCKTCIISLATSTLEHYLGVHSPVEKLVSPKSIKSLTFTTSLSVRDISDIINRKTPYNSWTLKFHSEVSNRKVTSIFHRNVDEIFPMSVSSLDLETTENNATFLTNTFPYHSYNFDSVSDKFF